MKTLRMTVAQALIRFLDRQYIDVDGRETKFVKGIFAIFGHGNVLGIGQALEEDCGQLTVHQGRNEQGMAHIATGFARQQLRQQIMACTASVGPGSANMVTAAATATANRIPLLLLPGDVFATRQPDPVLQQIEQSYDLSTSTNDAFRSVSKYWDRISRPEQLMSACINALRVLTDPAETGAVTLSLPQDVQAEVWDYPEEFFKRRVHRIERTPPTPAMIDDAMLLLKQKKYPLIICGGGVKYSQAGEALRHFAEKYSIPFAETQAGKGTLPSDHPLNVGGIGETGCIAANQLAKDADLIIGIGTRYTDFTTSSKWIFQHQQVNFLNINISRFDAYKLDGAQIVSDALIALQQLTTALSFEMTSYEWGDRILSARKDYEQEVKRLYSLDYSGEDFTPEVIDELDHVKVYNEFRALTHSSLTQSRVLGVLNQSLPNNAVIVAAAGSLPGDLQRIWQTAGCNDYHVEYGYSCMGYEVNAAVGVKLASPDRDVFALLGDGSFMMLHSELVTALQEGVKIHVVVFDNMMNGCINNLQMGHGMGSFCTEFRYNTTQKGHPEGSLIPIDFAKIAEGYGCKSYRITTLEQLHAALQDAVHQTVPVLFDIKVLPKTMAHGYESWWHVGVAQHSNNSQINSAAEKINTHLAQARKY